MKYLHIIFIAVLLIFLSSHSIVADISQSSNDKKQEQDLEEKTNEDIEMLTSLLDLQQNIKEQMVLMKKKLRTSKSETEKKALEEEMGQLDKQFSETANDFERIATGVELALFSEKKPETFSWKDEMASLVEPAIKELQRFTIRARQKSNLKDKIVELKLLKKTAQEAVAHLEIVLAETTDKEVSTEVKALQPEWSNIEKRLINKLELAERELAQLEEQEVSLVETYSSALKEFFRNRGLYLAIAILVFFSILFGCKLLYRVIVKFSYKLNSKKRQRSFNIRLLYLIFQVMSVILAVIGLFFVLYLGEDWFLLSMAIIFFLGLIWTIRQGLPKLWQQGRLMLNVGAVRENERLVLHGVPWKVASINVFCKLINPSLGVELRVPIEDMVGLVSRSFKQDEPWFPCKKGDWVVIGSSSRAKVVSLSHEQVEVVERGGMHLTYPTETFLQACPAVLSRNFRIRIPFGISYNLQKEATRNIPSILKDFLVMKLEDEGYKDKYHNIQVEFLQANASSLDLIILADFDGQVADIYKRLERAINRWCVDCCTEHNWVIPFPQLTIHKELGSTTDDNI